MTDVVFLYHPHTYDVTPDAQLGLGLLSIATHLRDEGVDVRVLNQQAATEEAAQAAIPSCRWLALYGCLVDVPIINRLAEAIRSGSRVVVGGPVARSSELLSSAVSLVVDGPGEDIVLDLAGGLEPNERRVTVSGLQRDINKYPFPRRDLIEGSTGGVIFVGSDTDLATSTILTSRGCRYRCAFCESGGRDQRVLNYDLFRIEKEVEHCLSLGIRALRVSDDNIINDPKRLLWLCDLFRRVGVKWRASLRVRPASVEMYQMLHASGCQEVSFGVESGDQDVLDVLRKGTRVEWNTNAVKFAKEGGIPVVRALMMMATPGETEQTIERNQRWVEEAAPTMVSFKVFVPYPGTAIHANPEKFGVRLFPLTDPNNSSYRPDGSTPQSNIEIVGGAGANREVLTRRFLTMRAWLEAHGRANYG
jgi:radical SAM superfamily enzyme YgiQ (UPF0313 family)